jgi:chromosome partitioning protein
VSPDYLSIIGVALLQQRVQKLSDDLENPIKSAGIVLSRVGRPSYFRTQNKNTLRATFGDDVFAAEIHERSAVSEAAAKSLSIFEMGDASANSEFCDFGEELLKRLGCE